jgi:hypothetical protein
MVEGIPGTCFEFEMGVLEGARRNLRAGEINGKWWRNCNWRLGVFQDIFK